MLPGAHPRQQLVNPKRLGQGGVRSGFEPRHNRFVCIRRRKQENWSGAALAAQSSDGVDPGAVLEVGVDHHDIIIRLLYQAGDVAVAPGNVDDVPAVAQLMGEPRHHGQVRFSEEQLHDNGLSPRVNRAWLDAQDTWRG